MTVTYELPGFPVLGTGIFASDYNDKYNIAVIRKIQNNVLSGRDFLMATRAGFGPRRSFDNCSKMGQWPVSQSRVTSRYDRHIQLRHARDIFVTATSAKPIGLP